MLLINLLLFIISLFALVKSADYSVRYSSRIAKIFHLSEFIISFFIVSVISTFPEGTISIISAINKVPEFGIGTLLGSNVADLSLVFGIIALFSPRGIKVKSVILKNNFFYLILLLVPIFLGFDGYFSRIDGLILVFSGISFFITLSINGRISKIKIKDKEKSNWKVNLFFLIFSLILLILSAYYTIKFGVNFANDVNIPPFLIALTIVAIGTCLPELIFSLKAVKSDHDSLALGDILGTVITDATTLVGIVALINPFSFNLNIIYITGFMMFIAGVLAISFIKSEKILSKREGLYLILFYIASLIIEFIFNQ